MRFLLLAVAGVWGCARGAAVVVDIDADEVTRRNTRVLDITMVDLDSSTSEVQAYEFPRDGEFPLSTLFDASDAESRRWQVIVRAFSNVDDIDPIATATMIMRSVPGQVVHRHMLIGAPP